MKWEKKGKLGLCEKAKEKLKTSKKEQRKEEASYEEGRRGVGMKMPKAGQGGVLLILKRDVNNGEKWLNLITAGSLVRSSPWELHASVSLLPPLNLDRS